MNAHVSSDPFNVEPWLNIGVSVPPVLWMSQPMMANPAMGVKTDLKVKNHLMWRVGMQWNGNTRQKYKK